MKLTKAIREECFQAQVNCTDKDDALKQAAELAKKCDELQDISVEQILQGFLDREAISTTGIGEGVAIPHCRIDGVKDFVVGVITLAKPIDFASIDGRKVSIIAFIVGPESNTEDHPRILSGLSLRLGTPEGRQKLLAATTSHELLSAFEVPSTERIEEVPRTEKRLILAIVQDDDLFHRVLGAIESIDDTSAVVIESSNINEHLTRMPVFASFLADTESQFSKVIMAIVPKALTNEALRRVESVTGSLDDHSDIAILVQDVFLALGRLTL